MQTREEQILIAACQSVNQYLLDRSVFLAADCTDALKTRYHLRQHEEFSFVLPRDLLIILMTLNFSCKMHDFYLVEYQFQQGKFPNSFTPKVYLDAFDYIRHLDHHELSSDAKGLLISMCNAVIDLYSRTQIS